MKTIKSNKLIAEFMDESILKWNDPSPIEGNDYRINKIDLSYYCVDKFKRDDDIIVIQYGQGSEAEVFRQEIEEIDLQYHSSWDWLMPVVERIGEGMDRIIFGYDQGSTSLEIIMYNHEGCADSDVDEPETSESLIDLTYQGVVEYINWYNKQKS